MLTETSVIAMCLRHDAELKQKAGEQRKATDDAHAEFLRTVEGLK